MATITVGPYQYNNHIDNILGSGTFGEVYAGFHSETKGKVAIKVANLSGKDEQTKVQIKTYFEREIEAFAGLPRHDHLVKLYHHEKQGEKLFLVMELCDGSINDYLEKTSVSPDEMMGFIVQIVDAVAHLHRHGYTHR